MTGQNQSNNGFKLYKILEFLILALLVNISLKNIQKLPKKYIIILIFLSD